MRAGPVGLWREHVCVGCSDLCRTGRAGTVVLRFSKTCKKIPSGWERMTQRKVSSLLLEIQFCQHLLINGDRYKNVKVD